MTGPMGSIGNAKIPQRLTRQQAGAQLCSPHPLLSGTENLRNRKTAKNGKSLTDFWVQLSDQSIHMANIIPPSESINSKLNVLVIK